MIEPFDCKRDLVDVVDFSLDDYPERRSHADETFYKTLFPFSFQNVLLVPECEFVLAADREN